MSTCSSWSGSPWTVSCGRARTCTARRVSKLTARPTQRATSSGCSLRPRQLGEPRIGADEAAQALGPRRDHAQAAPHVVAPVVGQRIAGDDGRQAAGDRLDRRQRVVQLVAEHAHQPLPGLQFLLAQGLGQIGDHHQFERQAALAELAAAHAPAGPRRPGRRCCSDARRAIEADFEIAAPPRVARAGAPAAAPAAARPARLTSGAR